MKGDIALSLETTVVSARVRAGATLAAVLRMHEVEVSQASAIVAQAGSVFDLRKVRANQPYRLETSHTGSVRGFEYEIDADRFLRVAQVALRLTVGWVGLGLSFGGSEKLVGALQFTRRIPNFGLHKAHSLVTDTQIALSLWVRRVSFG